MSLEKREDELLYQIALALDNGGGNIEDEWDAALDVREALRAAIQADPTLVTELGGVQVGWNSTRSRGVLLPMKAGESPKKMSGLQWAPAFAWPALHETAENPT